MTCSAICSAGAAALLVIHENRALKSASIAYQLKIYDGADHAFHNDTGTRYQAAAARDAWQRASEWFAKYV